MTLQWLQSSVLVFVFCLILVITSADNLKVSATAQWYEAKTLEGECPNTQDEFEAARSKLLRNIGPVIEDVLEIVSQMQQQNAESLTTGQTTEQSTEWPTGQTTDSEQSTPESSTTGQTTEHIKSTTTDPSEHCGGPGWRQVVFINMTDTSYNCPPGLKLTSYSKRTCGRAHHGYRNCSSTTFSIGGSEYSQVCGRIRGYQVGETDGFFYRSQPIDGYYVFGVSLTHGAAGKRQHIWTFAAGLSKTDNYYVRNLCPCDTMSYRASLPPPFVGNDYFCESGLHAPYIDGGTYYGVIFPDDPLWDGQNCTSTSTCCQLNNPPWFTKTLPNPTTDDIELRICLGWRLGNDDTPLELIELYIK